MNVPAGEFVQPALDAGQVERLVNRRAVELLPPTEAREEESRAPLWRLVMLTAIAVLVIEGVVSGVRSRRAAGVTP